jgi:predicted dehydrogenase
MAQAPRPRHIPRPPGPIDGGDPLAATGRTLRWGVVSTGDIARSVTPRIASMRDAALHAVSSRHPDKARAFAEEFGFATSYGDGDVPGYQLLADDPDVDVVYVATPHAFHHEVTRAVILAGKHALVEKAFTINAREAEDLAELARARGVFVMEAVWTRFLPVFQRVLDVIEAGEIGDVHWLQGDLGFRAAEDPRERLWAPEAGGGALLDLTVYPLTWALGALGFPASLSAHGVLTDDGVDGSNALTLSYGDGAHAQFLSTLRAQSTGSLAIGGTHGTIRTLGSLTGPGGFELQGEGVAREERFPTVRYRHVYQLREVTRCIQQGLVESPTMPLAHTVRTMRLFDEARRQLGVVYPNDAAVASTL